MVDSIIIILILLLYYRTRAEETETGQNSSLMCQ